MPDFLFINKVVDVMSEANKDGGVSLGLKIDKEWNHDH